LSQAPDPFGVLGGAGLEFVAERAGVARGLVGLGSRRLQVGPELRLVSLTTLPLVAGAVERLLPGGDGGLEVAPQVGQASPEGVGLGVAVVAPRAGVPQLVLQPRQLGPRRLVAHLDGGFRIASAPRRSIPGGVELGPEALDLGPALPEPLPVG